MAALDGSLSGWLGLPVVAFAISAISTAFAIRYAKRRRLIDQPGARRSHSQPTPRGGGIGIVVAVLLCVCVPGLLQASPISALTLGAAVLIVAAVGWIDDHRGLRAGTRFVAHCVAALIILLPAAASLLALSLDVGQLVSFSFVVAWLGLIVLAFAIVWSINLHNFMDGIDGILAAQAIFVFVALAILVGVRGHDPRALAIAVFAAATLGFLPFNFPRARIFMGDVGSGVLGLLVVVAVIWQFSVRETAFGSGLILCSAFVVDASCTLISRMVRGRHWYSAHREHLYQWLVRCGFSHFGVVALYMGWNLVIVVPVVAWINRTPSMPMLVANESMPSLFAVVAVYLFGAGVWILGKRRCLAAAKRRNHAAA
jgi:UDP-N-acetylmuramyl pentapeptide phosphotransferase/UDP-N-acetylglucosamine-1-phosphate transferase